MLITTSRGSNRFCKLTLFKCKQGASSESCSWQSQANFRNFCTCWSIICLLCCQKHCIMMSNSIGWGCSFACHLVGDSVRDLPHASMPMVVLSVENTVHQLTCSATGPSDGRVYSMWMPTLSSSINKVLYANIHEGDTDAWSDTATAVAVFWWLSPVFYINIPDRQPHCLCFDLHQDSQDRVVPFFHWWENWHELVSPEKMGQARLFDLRSNFMASMDAPGNFVPTPNSKRGVIPRVHHILRFPACMNTYCDIHEGITWM